MANIETYTNFYISNSAHLIENSAYKYVMSINYNEDGDPKKGSAFFCIVIKKSLSLLQEVLLFKKFQ